MRVAHEPAAITGGDSEEMPVFDRFVTVVLLPITTETALELALVWETAAKMLSDTSIDFLSIGDGGFFGGHLSLDLGLDPSVRSVGRDGLLISGSIGSSSNKHRSQGKDALFSREEGDLRRGEDSVVGSSPDGLQICMGMSGKWQGGGVRNS